ncbi:MAG: asparagine synthase (glutamine-hydrolyzing) [Terriglobia bacterium]
MCGICGKLILNDREASIAPDLLRRMMESIRHRGPDDEGLYTSGPVGLGHRRLSIIDLETGKQPISNEDGTVWVVFNGEIYNFKDLTSDLKKRGHRFRTATDTEVIVHLYEELGEECIAKLRGMFSFAVWDEKARMLLMARDRVGIKPLYYHLTPEALIFASEIKAILADPSVAAEADPTAFSAFLTHFYAAGEATAFKGIRKLSPGHYMSARDGTVKVKQYWDVHFKRDPEIKSLKESVEKLRSLLRSTVSDHMISDVPVGVLLSGGVDSTVMLSFAAEQATKDVSTFTIGFEGSLCTDERPFARLAAQRFSARHHEMTITSREFSDFLPQYVWHMEEPVCEPPAVALYYVSKLAKEHGVSVLISGEGGDEAFAGYPNYYNLVRLERLKSLMGPLAAPLGALAGRLGTVAHRRRLRRYAPLLAQPLQKYYYSRTSDPAQFFNRSRNTLFTAEFLASLNGNHPGAITERHFAAVRGCSPLNQMLYVDTKTWLPDDLLIKADRMTMANSLELRVPLLDHLVLEFAASLPARWKLNGSETKFIFKKALADRVPEEIRNRKKAGFPVPYGTWIRNDLKEMVWSVLMDSRTVQRGYFRKRALEQLLSSNDATHNHSKEIFSLLTMELWHRAFIDHA